ncbi:hypothetical protein QBC38DRAFT_475782 [Podospora fimiseda]|uniref:C2 domain-containing protein n=1 Tax=Podospora fimiseda TaxID=252190 RepID=A0AAN7H5D2_9PEZI|nr:hypothetical protein QBC38DRAFT_475782 [Podospora fimiseda]
MSGDAEKASPDGPSPSQNGILSKPSDLYKTQKEKLKNKSKPAGGFDKTPLPDAPQGYTVKFTFIRAFDLPIADLHVNSSDPFIHATLTAAVPKRHKEDPPLTHRTKTLRKTTEPEWNEDWVVANVPASGFALKCRLYDEDWPDHDDRLGNLTIKIPSIDENWDGFGPDGRTFDVKKRSGSKRAYFVKSISAAFCKNVKLTPQLQLGIQVLGKSDPPHAQMYTVGPTRWVKHYSPMIGRLTGVKVNKDESNDSSSIRSDNKRSKKFDFQATQIQLQGPVPPELYHRYVEFRPIIGRMFSSKGVRGTVLNTMLHKQHRRIYNYDSHTEFGDFEPCSEEASLQFLRMAHFDEGGRVFTYVITLDGLMRFTETGKEFGIDLLSKHSMHSDVATYIACSGEFFIRRLLHKRHHHHRHHQHPERSISSESSCSTPTHPPVSPLPNGPPKSPPPTDPKMYQLIIDNDSGTYRPDKSILPLLKQFLEKNFPGLEVRVMHCEDEELQKMKKEQLEIKKKEGPKIKMVLNRSPTNSSFSSDDESRLGDLEADEQGLGVKSKKEKAFDLVQNPGGWKEYVKSFRDKKGKGKSDQRQEDGGLIGSLGKGKEIETMDGQDDKSVAVGSIMQEEKVEDRKVDVYGEASKESGGIRGNEEKVNANGNAVGGGQGVSGGNP